MKKNNVLHIMGFAVELLLMSIVLAWPMFARKDLRRFPICDTPSEFRFRFRSCQEHCDMKSVKRLALVYFFNNDQRHDHKKSIVFSPTDCSKDGWFHGRFPAGVTNFKIDFRIDRSSCQDVKPPFVDEFLVGGSPILPKWLRYDYWFETDTPVLRYEPIPPLNGYLREFLLAASGIYLILLSMLGLVWFAIRRKGNAP